MTIQKLLESTIAAVALTSQPDNRTCKVVKHTPRESYNLLPYICEVELDKPLCVASGTPVFLKIEDAPGECASVPGFILDLEPSDCGAAYHDRTKVIIGTFVQVSGNCVALEWDSNAGDQAVVEKLEAMRQPDAIPNPALFSKTFNLPHHVAESSEHQGKSGPGHAPAPRVKCDDPNPAISASNDLSENLPEFDTVRAGSSDKPGLPPTEREELEALHRETATKDVVFVLGATDTIPASLVAAHLAQKFRAEGKSVMVVGRDSADVEMTWREWAKGLTNTDGVSNPALNFTREFGLNWQGAEDGLWDYLKRISEVDAQIAALVSQAKVVPGESESADKLEDLVAKRESCIKELQAATREDIHSAPLVFANLQSAILSPALLARTFDVVIILDADHTTIAEFIVLVGLAKTAVRPIGDCRQYPSLRPQPVAYECERTVDEFVQWDVFGFCGVTRNINNGVADPRLAVLRYQRNTHPQITQIVSRMAYGGGFVRLRDEIS